MVNEEATNQLGKVKYGQAMDSLWILKSGEIW